MLNRSASLAMSTSVLKALTGKFDIKRHSPSILYLFFLPVPVCIGCVVLSMFTSLAIIPKLTLSYFDLSSAVLVLSIPVLTSTVSAAYKGNYPGY